MRSYRFATLRVIGIAIVLVGGCDNGKETHETESSVALEQHEPEKIVVTILGCSARTRLLHMIAEANNVTSTETGHILAASVKNGNRNLLFRTITTNHAIEHAQLAAESDAAIFVADMTEGPLRVHREHAILLRQTGVPHVQLVFVNLLLDTDAELRDLVELEVRELLRFYDVPNVAAEALYDDPPTPSSAPNATLTQRLFEFASTVEPRRHRQESDHEILRADATIYVLVAQEQFTQEIVPSIFSGASEVLVRSEILQVDVRFDGQIDAGQNGTVRLEFPRRIRVADGERITLFQGGHVTAIGFIKL